MTVDHLLHHTSGLPPDFDSPEFSATPEAARHHEHQEFAEKFCQPALAYEPGTNWEYSNCGYNLLGLVLERLTGTPFETLLRQRILNPLGMRDSGLERNDLPQLSGAAGYLRDAGPRYTVGPIWIVFTDSLPAPCIPPQKISTNGIKRSRQAISFQKTCATRFSLLDCTTGVMAGSSRKSRRASPALATPWPRCAATCRTISLLGTLRYPERDAVIITLRNVYGSTEGFEQNIQAILFDAKPHLPSRSPKDLAPQICLVPIRWAASHAAFAMILLLFIAITIWFLSRRTRRA